MISGFPFNICLEYYEVHIVWSAVSDPVVRVNTGSDRNVSKCNSEICKILIRRAHITKIQTTAMKTVNKEHKSGSKMRYEESSSHDRSK